MRSTRANVLMRNRADQFVSFVLRRLPVRARTNLSRTNLSATLADGETTLTDALARRDALMLRYGTLKTLVSTASDRLPRYGRA